MVYSVRPGRKKLMNLGAGVLLLFFLSNFTISVSVLAASVAKRANGIKKLSYRYASRQ